MYDNDDDLFSFVTQEDNNIEDNSNDDLFSFVNQEDDDLFSFVTQEDNNSNQELSDKEAEFGFYISLMGINPLVVYKEDENVIFDIMMISGDNESINILLNNLNDFINELYKNSININGNYLYIKMKNNIINTYIQKVNHLISRFTSVTNLNINDTKISNTIDIKSLFTRGNIPAPISGGTKYYLNYHYTINSILPLTIEELQDLVSEINFILSYELNIASKVDNEFIENYRNKNYRYIENEIEILDALKFPPIFGCESILKQNTSTKSNRDIRLESTYRAIISNNVFYHMIINLLDIKKSLKDTSSIIYDF